MTTATIEFETCPHCGAKFKPVFFCDVCFRFYCNECWRCQCNDVSVIWVKRRNE